MHLGLIAAGVGPGDVVLTTPLTFCSTVHVIEHQGARPVLVDVDPDTLNISPAALETAVKQTTDVNEWMRLFALQSLGGIGDSYGFGLEHNLKMYQRPSAWCSSGAQTLVRFHPVSGALQTAFAGAVTTSMRRLALATQMRRSCDFT